MDLLLWFSIAVKILVVGFLAGLTGFVALPLLLAAVTQIRNRSTTSQAAADDEAPTSSLYVGRVWHTRLQPTHHGFNYPLFVFALDLEEVDDLFSIKLWPLSLIVSFRNMDHLKNGEGSDRKEEGEGGRVEKNEIANRVLRMVSEKTNNMFQPTLDTYRVLIVTHLCYYGYCFNPVSFYYVQEKATNKLVTVVAEVSNTPWNEMHCYVLHPDSIDQVQMKQEDKKKEEQNDKDPKPPQTINYRWPKRFHVSPFMEMNYIYDWTFTNFQLKAKEEGGGENDPLVVRAAMKRGGGGDDNNVDERVDFTAKVHCTRQGLHPYTIAWQLIYFPIYCFIIQIWIHYEAFWVFVKGVAFVPHPNDAETAVSTAIAAIMTPIFAMKDWLDQLLGKKSSSSSSSNVGTSTAAAGVKTKLN